MSNFMESVKDGLDSTLEALWQNLPDTVQGCGNTMVVMDDSGSMTWVTLPGSSARPLEVANALAIYFAERSSGQFKDQYMSFSDRPQLAVLFLFRFRGRKRSPQTGSKKG